MFLQNKQYQMGSLFSKASNLSDTTKDAAFHEWQWRLVHEQLIRERQEAYRLARQRYIFSSFVFPCGTLCSLICLAQASQKKSPIFVLPMLPLFFAFGYYYDMMYGPQHKRCTELAEQILIDSKSNERFQLPGGLPSQMEIRSRIAQLNENNSLPDKDIDF